MANNIQKLEKQIAATEKKLAALAKQKEELERRKEREEISTMLRVPARLPKSSAQRYEMFNALLVVLKKRKPHISVYRDGHITFVSVKVGTSYNQDVVPEKVRALFRALADKVHRSTYYDYHDDKHSVERYFFNVQPRNAKNKALKA